MVPLHRRPDGSYVVRHLSGLPFHITRDDPAWAEVDAAAPADLPPEPGPPPPPPPPPSVPASITARQLRLWLVRNGVTLAAVEAAIGAMDEPAQTEARIEWEYATQFERTHPLLRGLAAAVLGLDHGALDAALDAAFVEAAAY